MMEYAVTGNRNAAAFLAPMLQGIKTEIHIPGNGSFYGGPDTEDTAFLMHEANPPKKDKASFSTS